jgi:hypothetical protein
MSSTGGSTHKSSSVCTSFTGTMYLVCSVCKRKGENNSLNNAMIQKRWLSDFVLLMMKKRWLSDFVLLMMKKRWLSAFV